MKCFLRALFLGLGLLSVAVVQAQNWQNPLPQGNTFRDVALINDRAWAVGDFGTIYHSADLGETWLPQTSGTCARLTGVSFLDVATGWACGFDSSALSPALLKTTDGGATWNSVPVSPAFANPQDLCFVTALRGYVADDAAQVHRTTDGGDTWDTFALPAADFHCRKLFFASEECGWVSENGARLARTTDGGVTWSVHQVGDASYAIVADFAFPLTQTGFASVHFGTTGWMLWKTVDGGVTWIENHSRPNIGSASALAFSGFDHGLIILSDFWVNNQRFNTLRTADGGNTWDHSYSELENIPHAMAARSDGRYVAVGSSGALNFSHNGGRDWTPFSHGPTWDVRAVTFTDSVHGWAAGSNNPYLFTEYYGILYTEDAGRHWTEQGIVLNGNPIINDIRFTSPTEGWVAAQADLLHTTDGGAHWNRAPLPFYASFRDLSFTDPDHGWIAAVSEDPVWGEIFRTEDGGAHWTYYPMHTDILIQRLSFVSSTEGWGLTCCPYWDSAVLHTVDGGENWSELYTTGTWMRDIVMLDASLGWIVGAGSIQKTVNGGVNWTEQGDPAWHLLQVHAVDAQTLWASGENGLLVRTTDGGATWSEIASGTDNDLLAVHALNTETAWAVGTDGAIIQYGPLPEVASTSEPAPLPADFSLAAYPNPFNPQTTLSFTLPSPAAVQLDLFDLTGRHIETLTARTYPAGNHQLSVNLPHLASGIYLARLSAGSYTQTRRIVLLK